MQEVHEKDKATRKAQAERVAEEKAKEKAYKKAHKVDPLWPLGKPTEQGLKNAPPLPFLDSLPSVDV